MISDRFIKILFTVLLFSFCYLAYAQPVDEASAKKIAAGFFKDRVKNFEDKRLERISVLPETKTAANSAFYVFSTGGSGYAIIAGDKRMKPILAYSLEREFPKNADLPPALKAWLASLEEAVMEMGPVVDDGSLTDNRWREAVANTKGQNGGRVELQTALWDQSQPFNEMCPMVGNKRGLTGCLPTALSILMRYYQYPQGVVNVYVPSYDVNLGVDNVFHGGGWQIDYAWDWNNMPLTDGKNFSKEETKAVATLMRDIGGMVKTCYDKDGSGAAPERCNILMDSLGYDHGARYVQWCMYTHEDWMSLLSNEIYEGRPVLFAGWDYYTGGHAFIGDGIDEDQNFRMNWGWGGKYNGYYSMAPFAYENETRYPAYFFTLCAWIGLQPNVGNPKKPIPYIYELRVKEGLLDPDNPFTIVNPFIAFSDKPGTIGRMDVHCDLIIAMCKKDGTIKEFVSDVFRFYSANISIPCQITKDIEIGDYICLLYRYDDDDWAEALHDVEQDRGIIHLKEELSIEQATSIYITRIDNLEIYGVFYRETKVIKILTKQAALITLYDENGKGISNAGRGERIDDLWIKNLTSSGLDPVYSYGRNPNKGVYIICLNDLEPGKYIVVLNTQTERLTFTFEK